MPTPTDFSNYQFPVNRNTAGGDFSPTADAPATPEVPTGIYPNIRGYGYDPGNREFSSNVNGDPEALLEQTRAGVESHANLNEAYGLCQPVATLGVTPWLRDSLAVPGEEEPGNAEPSTRFESGTFLLRKIHPRCHRFCAHQNRSFLLSCNYLR